jgi:hypothetical protein
MEYDALFFFLVQRFVSPHFQLDGLLMKDRVWRIESLGVGCDQIEVISELANVDIPCLVDLFLDGPKVHWLLYHRTVAWYLSFIHWLCEEGICISPDEGCDQLGQDCRQQ